jgi:putative thioredoxin
MDLIIGDKPHKPAAGNGAATGASSADIVDARIDTFEAEVIKASMERPVLIDFWASWCGPCKQLTPVLEKIVGEAGGAVKLVKINADENPELCQMLQVQSLPTVFALYQGRPVDAFMGALPESQVRAFVTKLARMAGPSALPMDAMLEDAKAALEGGDAEQAYELYATVLEKEPENPKAIGGAARALIALGELEAAGDLLSELPPNVEVDSEISAAKAALEVAAQAGDAGELGELQAKVNADPSDLRARLDLAIALFSAGRHEPAMEQLIEIIGIDREWNEAAARQQLLKYFDTLGPANPLVGKFRRRLSTILFS